MSSARRWARQSRLFSRKNRRNRLQPGTRVRIAAWCGYSTVCMRRSSGSPCLPSTSPRKASWLPLAVSMLPPDRFRVRQPARSLRGMHFPLHHCHSRHLAALARAVIPLTAVKVARAPKRGCRRLLHNDIRLGILVAQPVEPGLFSPLFAQAAGDYAYAVAARRASNHCSASACNHATAVRLGLLLAVVLVCVAVAWARVWNSRRRAGPILGH